MSDKKQKYDSGKPSKSDETIADFSTLKKENPFSVPDNYFDTLPGVIQEKVMKKDNKSLWGLTELYFNKSKLVVTIVSGVLVLAMAVYFLINKQENITMFSDITVNDLLEYYPEIIESMDESHFYELLFSENGEGFHDYFQGDFVNDTILTEDDIFNYLSDENLENDLIYNL